MGSIWNGIKAALGGVLSFFYSIIPDYGIAIILLTITVSLILFPLTLKQTRSMRKMQEIQPEIKRLQKEHKGNREELNQELMALYKEKGVNPAAGCLPLIAQMPIWFALFQVLRLSVITLPIVAVAGVGTPVEIMAGDTVATVDGTAVDSWEDVVAQYQDGQPHQVVVDRNGQSITLTLPTLDGLVPTDEKGLSPDNIIGEDSALAGALKEGKTNFLGMDLLHSPSRAASDGISHAIPYIILILLVMVTGYYQQWQTTRTRKSSGQQTQQQQGMQTAMKIMPLFLGFISWNFPTGLIVYFAASAMFRIGQQAVILRLDDREETEEPAAPEPDEDTEPEQPRSGPAPNTSKKRKRRRRK